MGIGTASFETNQKRELTSPPIGPYVAPGASFDPTFVVMASAIVFPSNPFVHGTPIIWGILDSVTGHNSSFYTSAQGTPSERLQLSYPTVKSVLNTTITVDETLAGHTVVVGSTTGINSLEAPAYMPRTVGIRLTGDGSNTWVKSAAFNVASMFTLTTYNAADGSTSFNVTGPYGLDYDQISITYVGANNYGIQRVYAGLGIFNAKFVLIDRVTGLPVLANPTANDEVFIVNAGTQALQLLLNTWIGGNNDFMGTFTNFWVVGWFEAWMVASPLSTTTIEVRFQPVFPGATSYKLYRDTDPNFGTQVLIFTGPGSTFVDTGLTANTLYYYKLVAVVGGVDTTVTTFRTNTKAF